MTPTVQEHIRYILTRNDEPAIEHARNLMQLIILAQHRNGEVMMPEDAVLAELLRSAETRCWRLLWAIQPYPTLTNDKEKP
jgi:hypothetical protein